MMRLYCTKIGVVYLYMYVYLYVRTCIYICIHIHLYISFKYACICIYIGGPDGAAFRCASPLSSLLLGRTGFFCVG